MTQGYWIVHIVNHVKVKWFASFEESNKRASEMGWCKVVKAAS